MSKMKIGRALVAQSVGDWAREGGGLGTEPTDAHMGPCYDLATPPVYAALCTRPVTPKG